MASLAGLVVMTLAAMLASQPAHSVEIHKFEDPALEKRFRGLTYELRCLVCQNQNIADSDADLAKDLRLEVHRMLDEGKTNDEISQFMVDRYGEFVLYNPRVRPGTYLLWYGPYVLVALGIWFLLAQIKRSRARAAVEEPLDPETRRDIKELLEAGGESPTTKAKS